MADGLDRLAPEVSPEDCSAAFEEWRIFAKAQRTADDLIVHQLGSLHPFARLSYYQCEDLKRLASQGSWLKVARLASNLSGREVAARRGCSRASYFLTEQREREGGVTLSKMRELAAAMDCEFVYFIRPKGADSFAQKIWAQVVGQAIERRNKCYVFRRRSAKGRARGLAGAVLTAISQTKTRRSLMWSERRD